MFIQDSSALCCSSTTCCNMKLSIKDLTPLNTEAARRDELQAQQKRHSTTEEALSVAERSNAYRTILTHFSQRYPKLPSGLEALDTSKAAVAFDGMRVPLICLPDLHRLLPVLQLGFGELQDADAATLPRHGWNPAFIAMGCLIAKVKQTIILGRVS